MIGQKPYLIWSGRLRAKWMLRKSMTCWIGVRTGGRSKNSLPDFHDNMDQSPGAISFKNLPNRSKPFGPVFCRP
jgi:hypothetical protein